MKETSLLVQKYNPDWKNMFQEIREIIEDKLKDLLITIEHVGSTAVPGLAAKPIIDIDIIYKNETPLSEIVSSLNELGYQHNGDQGIPGREAFKRIPENSTHPILDTIKHHLYVCSEDNDELNRHIVFRDFLLANDWARDEYQTLKLKLAEEINHDHKTYALLKETRATTFIEDIIRRTEVEK